MSWTEELYKIYELNCSRKFDDNEPEMLPVSHSTANAQIEVTIDVNGEFRGARAVEKGEAVTVIPATEDSATRANGIYPMPYADKLVYIAGDYGCYAEGKRNDNSDYYSAYMKQLKSWAESEHTHFAVNALLSYLQKSCLMCDLIKSGVLVTDERGKLLPKTKIAGIAQEDSFVRFIVNHSDGICRTWEDKNFYESFIAFNNSLLGEKQLCYASGTYEPVTYKHPSKIRNSGDKAKIISANDESGFTYRGRFADKEQTVSMSYSYSQKMHNALRWLVMKQGQSLDSLTFVVWASALQEVPDITKKIIDEDDPFADEDDELISTYPHYMRKLKKRIFSYGEKMQIDTKVMIMGLDAATTGRMNISLYTELMSSDFLRNIEQWHSDTAWNRFNGKKKMRIVNSFSLYEIAKCALGTEQGAFIDCDKKVMRDTLLRLIPCVTEGREVPADIMHGLYAKASNPLAYDNSYNHNTVLETACGMIRRSRIKQNNIPQEGEYLMAYDPNNTDRSYLYGCLLAIADKAEGEAYDASERNVRVTNARRYWSSFSQRPYSTWGRIREQLIPYLNKLGKSQMKYLKRIDEILEKMSFDEFKKDSRLDNTYLLGYSHYTTMMFNEDTAKNKEEN